MGRGMILVVHVHMLSVSNRMRIALYMSSIDPVLNQIRQGFIQDFWLGGGIYWCINEAWKCERRGLGASPP